MKKVNEPNILHTDVRVASEQALMALFQLLLGSDPEVAVENYKTSEANNE